MTAIAWYLLGCGTGALFATIVCVFCLVAIWPDLKKGWRG